MPLRPALTVALYYAAWFASAFGAARDLAWPGLAVAMLAVGVHVGLSGSRRRDAVLVGISLTIGLACEATLIATGLIGYRTATPGLFGVPLWLAGLWAAFGTLAAVLTVFRRRLPLLAALGFIGGPAAYWAGERWGALALNEPRWLALLALAIIWSIVAPALVAAHAALDQPRPASLPPSD